MKSVESNQRNLRIFKKGMLLLSFVASTVATADAPETESTRGIMSDVVAAMRVALPLSLDDHKFADPSNRTAILTALRRLAESGERLEQHGAGGEASFAFLSHSLARDTRDIERRFKAGRTNEARFLLHHTTEVCVACHSRLPDAAQHPLGQELMAIEILAKLPAAERAQFEMATRQFEAAATSFESSFADPSVSPEDIDREGLIDTYLELCLRILNDPSRADRSLRSLLGRDDLPTYVRDNAEAWVASLSEQKDFARTDSPVIDARRLIAHAMDRTEFRDDRQALIPLITASGLLYRFLDSRQERSPEVGEAYYLLGVVEGSVGRSFWASQTEHLFETAIRIGPGEAYARSAFVLLEEFVITGYTGSAGTNVPPDEKRRLEELRRLIEDASAT